MKNHKLWCFITFLFLFSSFRIIETLLLPYVLNSFNNVEQPSTSVDSVELSNFLEPTAILVRETPNEDASFLEDAPFVVEVSKPPVLVDICHDLDSKKECQNELYKLELEMYTVQKDHYLWSTKHRQITYSVRLIISIFTFLIVLYVIVMGVYIYPSYNSKKKIVQRQNSK